MRTIPCATAITLTAEERRVLEALGRSTKTEARMRDRARIVLLAAEGVATREIGRIVGRYMATPDNAVVLSVDEKPSIQALERAQGYLKLPTGRALIGQSHDYKRHGTTTLFAALDVATGKVTGRHYKRRRRVEFLDFMNKLVAEYPEIG